MAFIAPAALAAISLYKLYSDSQASSDAQDRVNAASAQQLHNTDQAMNAIRAKRDSDSKQFMDSLARQMGSYNGASSVLSNMYGGQGSAPVGEGMAHPQLQGLRGPLGGPGVMAPPSGVNIGAGPNAGGLPMPGTMAPPNIGGMMGGPNMGPMQPPGMMAPPNLAGMMGGPGMGRPSFPPGMASPFSAAAGPSGGGVRSLASLLGPGGFGGLTGGLGPVGGF